MPDNQVAQLYRMVLPDHTCPFGVRAKKLLQDSGYEVDDNVLSSRDEVDNFQAEHQVSTTPLIFIGERCIGGCDDLETFLKNRTA